MRSTKPGDELPPELLLQAYAAGLFPMSEGAEDPELFWVDPELRGIFPLDGIKVSKSLAKVVRGDGFMVSTDRDFDAVIAACAEAKPDRPSTWINATIRRSYGRLFALGYAHTVEVYRAGTLVGGLYGVALGGAFFGESMFHRERDASKVALVHLAASLRAGGYALLDTQFVTPHLATLGAIEIPRRDYRKRLAAALKREGKFTPERAFSGRDALAWLGGVPPASDQRPAGSLPPNSLE